MQRSVSGLRGADSRCTTPPKVAPPAAPRRSACRTIGRSRTCRHRGAGGQRPRPAAGATTDREGQGHAAGRRPRWPWPPVIRRSSVPAPLAARQRSLGPAAAAPPRAFRETTLGALHPCRHRTPRRARSKGDGALGGTRTHGLLLRRQTLYPLSYERGTSSVATGGQSSRGVPADRSRTSRRTGLGRGTRNEVAPPKRGHFYCPAEVRRTSRRSSATSQGHLSRRLHRLP